MTRLDAAHCGHHIFEIYIILHFTVIHCWHNNFKSNSDLKNTRNRRKSTRWYWINYLLRPNKYKSRRTQIFLSSKHHIKSGNFKNMFVFLSKHVLSDWAYKLVGLCSLGIKNNCLKHFETTTQWRIVVRWSDCKLTSSTFKALSARTRSREGRGDGTKSLWPV